MKRETSKFDVFSERLTAALKEKHMSKTKLAQIIGIDKSNITVYTNGSKYGRKSIPNGENLQAIANALGVTTNWLLGEDDASNVSPVKGPMRTINILALISCGGGIYNDGEIIDTISLPAEMFVASKEYFAMYAVGDSMIGAGILEGDLLIFERTDIPEQNKIGAFCINNETALCKKYKSGNDKIFLLSANDKYEPIVIDVYDKCFRCVGILRKILKSVD